MARFFTSGQIYIEWVLSISNVPILNLKMFSSLNDNNQTNKKNHFRRPFLICFILGTVHFHECVVCHEECEYFM